MLLCSPVIFRKSNQSITLNWLQEVTKWHRKYWLAGKLPPPQHWAILELIYKRPVGLYSAKYGCYIGFCFVGVLAYADDLVLLAPSPNARRNMLKICDEFGQRYSVIFNAIKSECLLCLSSSRSCHLPHATTPVFYIGGNVCKWVCKWMVVSRTRYLDVRWWYARFWVSKIESYRSNKRYIVWFQKCYL